MRLGGPGCFAVDFVEVAGPCFGAVAGVFVEGTVFHDADDAVAVLQDGDVLQGRRRVGVPNLCALTTLPPRGQLRGVPAALGGLHNRRAVVAGGGPAARQAHPGGVNEAR